MEIYNHQSLYAVGIVGMQGRLVELSATRRTLREEARFEIYLYHHPEEESFPTGVASFNETSVGALLYLISHKQNIDTLSGDGKRLTFVAEIGQLAIYNEPLALLPAASVRHPQICEYLSQDIQEGFFRALGLKQPVLTL